MHVVTASSISRIQIHQYEINILVVLDSSSSFGLGFDVLLILVCVWTSDTKRPYNNETITNYK